MWLMNYVFINKLEQSIRKYYTILSYMRQFYLTFPNHHALSDKLSWTLL